MGKIKNIIGIQTIISLLVLLSIPATVSAQTTRGDTSEAPKVSVEESKEVSTASSRLTALAAKTSLSRTAITASADILSKSKSIDAAAVTQVRAQAAELNTVAEGLTKEAAATTNKVLAASLTKQAATAKAQAVAIEEVSASLAKSKVASAEQLESLRAISTNLGSLAEGISASAREAGVKIATTTRLTASKAVVAAGESINLAVAVTKSAPSEKALSGVINIYDGDKLVATKEVDSKADATNFELSASELGLQAGQKLALRAEYAGDASFDRSESESKEVAVEKTAAKLALTSDKSAYGSSEVAKLAVKATDEDGKALDSGEVVFYANGEEVGRSSIAEGGTATLDVDMSKVAASDGKVVFSSKIVESDTVKESASNDVEVAAKSSIKLTVTAQADSARVGDKQIVTVKAVDEVTGEPIVGHKVDVMVDGEKIGEVITDENGEGQLEVSHARVGENVLSAQSPESSEYDSSESEPISVLVEDQVVIVSKFEGEKESYTSGEEVVILIELEAVVDEEGQPTPGFVEVTLEDGTVVGLVEIEETGQGQLVLPAGMEAGVYTFIATPVDGEGNAIGIVSAIMSIEVVAENSLEETGSNASYSMLAGSLLLVSSIALITSRKLGLNRTK